MGPIGNFDWDAPEWRACLRALPREARDNCPYVTLDSLHPNYARVYGIVAGMVLRRIADYGHDREARRLYGLLPRILLVERRFTRFSHGSRIDMYMQRVRMLLALRELPQLLEERDVSTRTRASSVRTDDRTRADVLKSCRLGQYSYAGQRAMSAEVADHNVAAENVAEGLYPIPDSLPTDLPEPEVRVPLDRALFMRAIGADGQGRVKIGRAADSAGHRWEHIEWIVEAGGAEDLYTVCNRLWLGQMQEDDDEDWQWVFNAKLVLLVKKVNERTLRHDYAQGDLRPIAPGSILLLLIGGVGAKQGKPAFRRLFDPGTVEGAPNGEIAPVLQAGAAIDGAAEQVQHSVVDRLASNPDHFCLQVDGEMAFQLVNRTTFLLFQHRHRLPTYTWSKRCYGKRSYVYMRRSDGSIRGFIRDGGTSQGDPCSPGNECMGLMEALAAAQEEFADALGSAQFWYMDDGSLCASFDDLVTFLNIVGSDEFEERTGYRMNFPKSSLWHRGLVEWDELGEMEWMDADVFAQAEADNETARLLRLQLQRRLPPACHAIRGVRDPRVFHASDPPKVAEEIQDSRGVFLLGAPICGTSDFTERKLMAIVRKAEAYVSRLQELLLPDHSEEYAQLTRVTLPGRFQHVCRSVIPSRVLAAAKAFDDLQVNAYRAFCGSLCSDDLPAREVIFAQEGAGGRGYREMAVKVFELYDGAWADQYDCVGDGWVRPALYMPNGLLLWDILQDYARAVLHMRHRRQARLRVGEGAVRVAV